MIENSPTNNSLLCKVCRSEARDLDIPVMHTTGLLHQAERRVRRRSLSALALRADKDQAVAILDTIGRDRETPLSTKTNLLLPNHLAMSTTRVVALFCVE
jgi:hypothetical protein